MNYYSISRLANLLAKSIYQKDPPLDYKRITDGFITLANKIDLIPPDENLWWIETSWSTIDEMIVGAYWHYTEHHGDQSSPTYAALCAIGDIYAPNFETPDDDNITYQLLNITYQRLNELAVNAPLLEAGE